MAKRVDVEIVRVVKIDAIMPFDNADAIDGILLNHSYVDMRGCTIADAEKIVAEEAQVLADIAAVDDDLEAINEILDGLYEDASELSAFDIGTAGAIFSLSAAGAAPISSCNGGMIDGSSHSSEIPHVLFSISPGLIDPILVAAKIADVGIVNNAGHLELFSDKLSKLNEFSSEIVKILQFSEKRI